MRTPGLDPAVREGRMGIEVGALSSELGDNSYPQGIPMEPFEAVDHEPLPHCLQPV